MFQSVWYQLYSQWQFGNNKHLTRSFAPVVNELGNIITKTTTDALHDTRTLDVATAAQRDNSLEDDSVSSVETDYEYALTDITTDGWKVEQNKFLSS